MKFQGSSAYDGALVWGFRILLASIVLFVADTILVLALGLDDYLLPGLLNGLIRHIVDLFFLVLVTFAHILAFLVGAESLETITDDIPQIIDLLFAIIFDDLLFFLGDHAATIIDAAIRAILGIVQDLTGIPLLDLYLMGVDGFVRASELVLGLFGQIAGLESELGLIKGVLDIGNTTLSGLLGFVTGSPLEAGIIAVVGSVVLLWAPFPGRQQLIDWLSTWTKDFNATDDSYIVKGPDKETEYDLLAGDPTNDLVTVSASDVEAIWEQTSDPVIPPPGGGGGGDDWVPEDTTETTDDNSGYTIVGYRLKSGAADRILKNLKGESSLRGFRAGWETLKIQENTGDVEGANVIQSGSSFQVKLTPKRGVAPSISGLDAVHDLTQLPKDAGATGLTQTEDLVQIYNRTLTPRVPSAEDILDQKRAKVLSDRLKDRFKI
jgi:hypothetical protein